MINELIISVVIVVGISIGGYLVKIYLDNPNNLWCKILKI
jgi:hypothetical protein